MTRGVCKLQICKLMCNRLRTLRIGWYASCQSHIEIIYQIQIYIISKNRPSVLKEKSMIGFKPGTLALQACLLTTVPRG